MGVIEEQLDLFAASGVSRPRQAAASAPPERPAPGDLDDAALIAAIPTAGVVEGPAAAMEAGRRRLVAAVSALEELCRRFAGFGLERAVPEQVAALEALVAIGGAAAARAVARVIVKGVVQGPALKVALAAAARLGSDLPPGVVMTLLGNPDPEVRADACRCVGMRRQAVPLLLDLLHEADGDLRAAAACALGRLGRREALPALARLLREAPSPEAIEAVTPIADEDCVVLLGRLVRTMPSLAACALDALDAVDHPRAGQLRSDFAERR